MTRQQAVDFLKNNPAKFAKMLGFTKLGSLHNRWIIEMVRGHGDHTLQASRGTYKTTCVSIALALIIILLPNKRTMFMRKTDTDVKEVVKQVQKILKDSHTQYFVQCIYSVNLSLLTESATEVTTNLTTDIKGTSQLIGIGSGSSITGKHFDFIFTDDIVNVQDRTSKAERDRTKVVYQELHNIKNRDGRIFNSGTPWHPDDCFSIMPTPEKYDCYHKEIRKIITKSELDELRKKMLPSLFAANYELRHIAVEDVIFTNPRVGAEPSLAEQGLAHIDAAYGGEDYTAFTICRKSGGKYYVFGKLWHKHVDDCLPEILALRQKFNAGRIYNEDNADKGYLNKSLRAKDELTMPYHESMNKFMKIVTYLKAEWLNVYFVQGTDADYINQVCDYFEQAEHDDAPDSLASLIRVLWRRTDEQDSYKPIFG